MSTSNHSPTSYEASKRLIQYTARRVHRRMFAAGARTVMLEDIVGELNIAWVIATQKWEESRGVPFGAYLMRGMSFHINRWVDHQIKEFQLAPFSIDIDPSSDDPSEAGANDRKNVSIDMPGADEILIAKDTRERVLARMTPMTRRFVELLESPPEDIVAEHSAIQIRSAYGRSRGINCATPSQVSSALIFDFLGCTTVERRNVYREINGLAKKVSQQ